MSLEAAESSSSRQDTQLALAAVDHLAELLRNGADLERIVDGYIEVRQALLKAFRKLAQARVPSCDDILSEAQSRVVAEMRRRFGKVVPEELIWVRSYGKTHLLLLAYLNGCKGNFVAASRLRLMTGDQVHTERRIRELRDLGFAIQAEKVSGESHYALSDAQLDIGDAATRQLRSNIKASKKLSGARKQELLSVLDA
jgi:hypothetical protein